MKTQTVADLLADVAHRVIVPRFRTLHADQIVQKHPGDLVTVADTEAEAEIAEALRDYHPDALIIGEESVFAQPDLLAALGDAEHAFVIDPVDGTNNFAHGSPDFGVMLAECRGGEAVRAWIWQPIHEEMFVAERGGGVTRNGKPMAPVRPGPKPYRVGAPRSLRRADAEGLDLRRTLGSCAIDYPRLLTGGGDAVAYRKQNPWDHLPGSLMVTELGGRAATHEGEDYRVGVHGSVLFAAASPEVWREVDARLVTPAWLAEYGLTPPADSDSA